MDDPVKRQMAAFAAARVATPVHLEPTRVSDVLAVFDGTDQDPTVDALAAAIATRTGARVRSWRGDMPDPAKSILAAASGCQVMVVPSPFRHDYCAEGHESLSTTVDLLLSRSTAAVCIARAPLPDAVECVSKATVALAIGRHHKVEATALALALVRGGGDLALLSVIDPHQPIRNEELLGRYLDPGDLSPDVLHGLASARAAALTAELQRRAREWRIKPSVKFAVGDPVDVALAANEPRGGLLVAGRDRDPRSEAAQQAHRLVLGSDLPVLLV